MEDILKTPIHITDAKGLDIVNGLLHDESFDLDQVHFDKDAGVVTIPARRQFHSGPERVIRKGLFSKTYEKGWMRTLITIRAVQSREIHRDQHINSYTFNSWNYSDGILKVQCNEEMILAFPVEGVDIELTDTGFQAKARITRWFGFIEGWSSGKVYE